MADFTINDAQLRNYISGLNSADRGRVRSSAKWIKKFTAFTERRMKKYAGSKSARSTGNLSNSITSRYKWSGNSVSGEVFVPERIKYQFASEYGFKRRFVIQGKPLMAFPEDAWKKARRGSSIMRLGKKGVYIFARVRRGRYKGRRFVERAFNDLLAYYASNQDAVLADIGQNLVFARNV
jgi:hypothetical protein